MGLFDNIKDFLTDVKDAGLSGVAKTLISTDKSALSKQAEAGRQRQIQADIDSGATAARDAVIRRVDRGEAVPKFSRNPFADRGLLKRFNEKSPLKTNSEYEFTLLDLNGNITRQKAKFGDTLLNNLKNGYYNNLRPEDRPKVYDALTKMAYDGDQGAINTLRALEATGTVDDFDLSEFASGNPLDNYLRGIKGTTLGAASAAGSTALLPSRIAGALGHDPSQRAVDQFDQVVSEALERLKPSVGGGRAGVTSTFIAGNFAGELAQGLGTGRLAKTAFEKGTKALAQRSSNKIIKESLEKLSTSRVAGVGARLAGEEAYFTGKPLAEGKFDLSDPLLAAAGLAFELPALRAARRATDAAQAAKAVPKPTLGPKKPVDGLKTAEKAKKAKQSDFTKTAEFKEASKVGSSVGNAKPVARGAKSLESAVPTVKTKPDPVAKGQLGFKGVSKKVDEVAEAAGESRFEQAVASKGAEAANRSLARSGGSVTDAYRPATKLSPKTDKQMFELFTSRIRPDSTEIGDLSANISKSIASSKPKAALKRLEQIEHSAVDSIGGIDDAMRARILKEAPQSVRPSNRLMSYMQKAFKRGELNAGEDILRQLAIDNELGFVSFTTARILNDITDGIESTLKNIGKQLENASPSQTKKLKALEKELLQKNNSLQFIADLSASTSGHGMRFHQLFGRPFVEAVVDRRVLDNTVKKPGSLKTAKGKNAATREIKRSIVKNFKAQLGTAPKVAKVPRAMRGLITKSKGKFSLTKEGEKLIGTLSRKVVRAAADLPASKDGNMEFFLLNKPDYARQAEAYDSAIGELIKQLDLMTPITAAQKLDRGAEEFLSVTKGWLLTSPTSIVNAGAGTITKIATDAVSASTIEAGLNRTLKSQSLESRPFRSKLVVKSIADVMKLGVNPVFRAATKNAYKNLDTGYGASTPRSQTTQLLNEVAGRKPVRGFWATKTGAHQLSKMGAAMQLAFDAVARLGQEATEYDRLLDHLIAARKLPKKGKTAKSLKKDLGVMYNNKGARKGKGDTKPVDKAYGRVKEFVLKSFEKVGDDGKPMSRKAAEDLYDITLEKIAANSAKIVYNDPDALFGAVRGLNKIASQGGPVAHAINLVAIFRSVAFNIVEETLNKTPVFGVVKGIAFDIPFRTGLLGEKFKFFKPTVKRSKTEMISKIAADQAIGFGMLGLGYELSRRGIYHGELPDEPNERQYWKDNDIRPHSLRFGDFEIPLLSWLPFTVPALSMGSSLERGMKEGEDTDSIASEMILAPISAILEAPLATYANEALRAVERDDVTRLLNPTASRIVPNLFGAISKLIDDTKVDYTRLNFVEKAILVKAPFLRNFLPNKTDSVGREIIQTKSEALTGVKYGVGDKPPEVPADFVREELDKFTDLEGSIRKYLKPSETGNNDLLAQLPELKDEAAKERVKDMLTKGDEKVEKHELKALDDHIKMTATEEIYRWMQTDVYKSASEEDKEAYINKIFETSAKAHRLEFVARLGLAEYVSPDQNKQVRDLLNGKQPRYRLGGDRTFAEQLEDAQYDFDINEDPDEVFKLNKSIAELEIKAKYEKAGEEDIIEYYTRPQAELADKLNRIYHEEGEQASVAFFSKLVKYGEELELNKKNRLPDTYEPNPKYRDKYGKLQSPSGWILNRLYDRGTGGKSKRLPVLPSFNSSRSGRNRTLTAEQARSIIRRGGFNK